MAPASARRNTAITASILYLIAIPFLVLVLIGNIRINGVLNEFYFFKLDVSHIIPISVANSQLLNSVARSLGLHDFYSVGLWNFCEGYIDEFVTLDRSFVSVLISFSGVLRFVPSPYRSIGLIRSKFSSANC